MKIENVLGLLGGLALFLYGMQMMSVNLEGIAGNKMKSILEKLTSNRFLGVFVGAGITALIQSSSATTVMVVGFVNSGLMTLQQTVWIIMGANIGTTITGQLIALDVNLIAPLIAFVGVIMVVFSKSKKISFIGGIIAGLGILFIGMGMMSDAMVPLQESPGFIHLMTTFSNPLIGILAGALFTAVIQSSSASVGILQALAIGGLIGLDSAVFVLFGQNIGTCITAVLASIGTNRNAKRTTVIHLLFNVIGTAIFVIICLVTPFTAWVQQFTPSNPAAQIANVHTIFNICTTLMLLPFGTFLAKIAVMILPDRVEQPIDYEEHWLKEIMSSNHVLGTSTVAIYAIVNEIKGMYYLVKDNVQDSLLLMSAYDEETFAFVKEREDRIDLLNMKIAKKISKVLAIEQSYKEVKTLNNFFKILTNLERIGDHAMNFAEAAQTIKFKQLSVPEDIKNELKQIKEDCLNGLDIFRSESDKEALFKEADVIEQMIDDHTSQYRSNQVLRLNQHTCPVETAILFSDVLTDYERIGDHILNLAESFSDLSDFDFSLKTQI